MAISVYDVLKQKQQIEDREDKFKTYSEISPVDCVRAAELFKTLGDTVKQVLSNSNSMCPDEINGYTFVSHLYYLKGKALEIERSFHKFRSVCLDDNKKKEELYETLYRELQEVTEELDKVARTLPSRPDHETQEQEATTTVDIKSNEGKPLASHQSIPSFMRTSTSTL